MVLGAPGWCSHVSELFLRKDVSRKANVPCRAQDMTVSHESKYSAIFLMYPQNGYKHLFLGLRVGVMYLFVKGF